MKSLWILLLSLTLSTAVRDLKYDCYGGGRLNIQYIFRGNDTVNNIFSTDPENNCSLSNNDFIGNGTKDSPYEITIDINRGQKSYKPCGAKISNGQFEVGFAIKSFEDFFGTDDTVDSILCSINMTKDKYTKIYVSHPYSKYGFPKIHPKMMLVPANPEGTLILGQKVKLRFEIPPNPIAKRSRVSLCHVRDTLDDNVTYTFYNTKCPFQSYPVPIKFVTNKTTPDVIESTEFKLFRFSENGTVQFNCFVEFCDKETDPYCLETDKCVPLGTFLHPYKEVKMLIRPEIDNTNSATNRMSSALVPVTSIMILLTKINWF